MTKADVKARKMAIALEEMLGSEISRAPRGAGFDVLAFSGDVEKHIEAKGIEHNDTFFAINGLAGVRGLLFDKSYYIYFCDVNSDEILITMGDFIFRSMGWSESEGSKKLIRAWTDTADAIKEVIKVTVDGRIRFSMNHPIRRVIRDLERNPDSIDLHCVRQ